MDTNQPRPCDYTSELNSEIAPFSYRSIAPDDCPWPQSREFVALEFTGRYRNYTNADTWYPTWAEDDALYSPWTDGYILHPQRCFPADESHPGDACNSLDFLGRKAATAQARITGDDPLNLTVENLAPRVDASPLPFGGRYPCGSLCYKGIWYYGTYCLTDNPEGDDCNGAGWTEFGPFVGFRISKDYGKSWLDCPHSPDVPIFGEDPRRTKVKIGSPHFVDFGKDLKYTPDGYAYLLAHGASAPKAWNNWIQGDEVYLFRVKPALDTMNNASQYQFYAGQVDDSPKWTSDFGRIQPLLKWPQRMGCVTASYHPGFQKYLMFITRGTSANTGDTQILESDSLTGPWSLVQYLPNFGPLAYFINAPSKFISATDNSFWLCYSANYLKKDRPANPAGSHYSMSLHEVRLVRRVPVP